MTQDPARCFDYALDARDHICAVSDAWIEFARQNGASELVAEAVIGRRVWDFVGGEEIRHLYRQLFGKVRATRRPVTVPFRCDAPSRRRFMELTMLPAEAEALNLESALIREEPREPIALLDRTVSRTLALVTVCAWCKRVLVTTGDWVEVEEAVARLDLFSATSLPGITHGICRNCRASLDRQLAR